MVDEIILKTVSLIKSKYLVDDDTAFDYARKALDALEAHGGTREDFQSVIKVVDVVVKSWLEQDGNIVGDKEIDSCP